MLLKNCSKRKSRGVVARIGGIVLRCALGCVLLCGLSGCKPTDFFTEIIIDPFAETVDVNNEDKTTVNSPDAEKESAFLTALEWTDESPQSKNVENLVVYSSEPTSEMPAHHSVFDLYPMFPGIEASDGVRLLFDEESSLDDEPDEVDDEQDEEPQQDIESEVPGLTQTIQETLIEALSTDTGATGSTTISSNALYPAETSSVDDNTENIPPSSIDDATENQDEPETESSAGGGGEQDEPDTESSAGGGGEQDEPDTESSAGGGGEQDEPEENVSDQGTPSDNVEQGGSGGSGDSSGGSSPTETPNEGTDESDNPETEGEKENPYGGLDGTLDTYNPNDAFAQVNSVNSFAVIGTDVAVMAQAIGGTGAICAMSEWAYLGYDNKGYETTGSYFGEMFAHELPSDFTSTAIFWQTDGSSKDDWYEGKDVDALIDVLGQNGLIIYDQNLVSNYEQIFTLEERTHLQAAGIQMAPVDMETVQGMLDAAQVIGDALSESDCAQDVSAMADTYRTTVSNIVSAVNARTGNHGISGSMATEYGGCPVGVGNTSTISAPIATDSETGVRYSGVIDTSGILLFDKNNTWRSTPLFFWKQVAGLISDADTTEISSHKTGLRTLWPLGITFKSNNFKNYSSDGAFSHVTNDSFSFMYWDANGGGDQAWAHYGLGSSHLPYLIVCASDGKNTSEIKNLVVNSMYSNGTTYYAPPLVVTGGGIGGTGSYMVDGTETTVRSFIGEIGGSYSSPFYSGLDRSDVVRENPTGLLGNWTEGNMESVLESIWLSEIYSESLGTSDAPTIFYDGSWMGDLSVTIGEYACDTAADAMLAFYRTFYRCNLDDAVDQQVTSYINSLDW